jgi:hypothetical protein
VIHKPILPRAHRKTLRGIWRARIALGARDLLAPWRPARRAARVETNDAEIAGSQRIAALQRFQNIVDRIEASYCLISNKSCGAAI